MKINKKSDKMKKTKKFSDFSNTFPFSHVMVIETEWKKVRLMNTHEINNRIEAVSRGDSNALGLLYEELSKPVYFYAFRLCESQEIAEDVMQETFLTVWEKAKTFFAKNGRAWIFTIAKNKTLDKLRECGKQTELDDYHAESSNDLENALSELAFWQRLAPLSEKERDVVSLRLLSGFTLTEVAEELQIPKGTVFWTYQNAIKKLRNKKGGER